jgi:hypothetical protein
VPAGRPVRFILRARNTSTRAIELHLLGRTIAFDIVVTDPIGVQVWRRLEGEVVPSILRLERLGAGDILEFRHEWDQRATDGSVVPPGTYAAFAILPTDAPIPLQTRAIGFRIR